MWKIVTNRRKDRRIVTPRRNLKNGKWKIGVFSENQKGWQVMLWSAVLNKKRSCMLVLIKWVNTLVTEGRLHGLQQATIYKCRQSAPTNGLFCRLYQDWENTAETSFFLCYPGGRTRVPTPLIYVCLHEKEQQWRPHRLSEKLRSSTRSTQSSRMKKGKVVWRKTACCIRSVLIDRNIRRTNNSAGARRKTWCGHKLLVFARPESCRKCSF